MFRTLGGKAYKQFVVARPWQDGVPGFLRGGILVAFHFYVWAAFWQLSGAKRTPADDALMRRLGTAVETVAASGTRREARSCGSSSPASAARSRRNGERLSPSQSASAKRSSESVPFTSMRLRAIRSQAGRLRPGAIVQAARKPALATAASTSGLVSP